MICDKDLPTSLWEEASNTNIYIQNRIPHVILGEKTPKEVFIGEKPDVGHFNIFICLVYIHVQKERRTNIEPSIKKWTFFGYSESSKAYRIYVPIQRHVEVTIDVTFNEEATLKRSK